MHAISITFSRKNPNIKYNYTTKNNNLSCINKINDLEILNDSKLCFIPHVENIINKSLKMLILILRNTRKFKESEIKITLFK